MKNYNMQLSNLSMYQNILLSELCFRAMVSKCVDENEVGRVFAVISIISAISSSLITAGFQAIYSASLEVFPEAYLLVNAGLFSLALPNNFLLRKHL